MENYFEIRILNVRKDCNMRMLSLENINGQVELSEYSGYKHEFAFCWFLI